MCANKPIFHGFYVTRGKNYGTSWNEVTPRAITMLKMLNEFISYLAPIATAFLAVHAHLMALFDLVNGYVRSSLLRTKE